jgi:hypothetical protein
MSGVVELELVLQHPARCVAHGATWAEWWRSTVCSSSTSSSPTMVTVGGNGGPRGWTRGALRRSLVENASSTAPACPFGHRSSRAPGVVSHGTHELDGAGVAIPRTMPGDPPDSGVTEGDAGRCGWLGDEPCGFVGIEREEAGSLSRPSLKKRPRRCRARGPAQDSAPFGVDLEAGMDSRIATATAMASASSWSSSSSSHRHRP